jgi:hypothetical protein
MVLDRQKSLSIPFFTTGGKLPVTKPFSISANGTQATDSFEHKLILVAIKAAAKHFKTAAHIRILNRSLWVFASR